LASHRAESKESSPLLAAVLQGTLKRELERLERDPRSKGEKFDETIILSLVHSIPCKRK